MQGNQKNTLDPALTLNQTQTQWKPEDPVNDPPTGVDVDRTLHIADLRKKTICLAGEVQRGLKAYQSEMG